MADWAILPRTTRIFIAKGMALVLTHNAKREAAAK